MTPFNYILVDARSPHWQKEVVRLGHSQIPFVVTGATSLLEKLFIDGLKVAYNLDVTDDENGTRFTPKTASPVAPIHLEPSPSIAPYQPRI
jgi:hypothetical protein